MSAPLATSAETASALEPSKISCRDTAAHALTIVRDGVITGYHARVNPAELGAALLVFVEITLDHKSGNMFDQFRREVQKIPEVLECHLVSGDFDYLIKARIGEMADYRKLLGDILLQLPGAVQSKSYVVMEEIKETLTIAVGE